MLTLWDNHNNSVKYGISIYGILKYPNLRYLLLPTELDAPNDVYRLDVATDPYQPD